VQSRDEAVDVSVDSEGGGGDFGGRGGRIEEDLAGGCGEALDDERGGDDSTRPKVPMRCDAPSGRGEGERLRPSGVRVPWGL
jgi:hypothetical protein